MTVKNSEVIGKPKIAFKTTSQAAQVSSFRNRGSKLKSFGFLIASMMLGLRFTVCDSCQWPPMSDFFGAVSSTVLLYRGLVSVSRELSEVEEEAWSDAQYVADI